MRVPFSDQYLFSAKEFDSIPAHTISTCLSCALAGSCTSRLPFCCASLNSSAMSAGLCTLLVCPCRPDWHAAQLLLALVFLGGALRVLLICAIAPSTYLLARTWHAHLSSADMSEDFVIYVQPTLAPGAQMKWPWWSGTTVSKHLIRCAKLFDSASKCSYGTLQPRIAYSTWSASAVRCAAEDHDAVP